MDQYESGVPVNNYSKPLGNAWAYQKLSRKPVPSSAFSEGDVTVGQADTGSPDLNSDPPESTRPSTKQSVFLVWWLELVCCFITLAALLAIVIVLLPYHDTPLPQLPYHVSINTVISVLSTVLKTCSLVVVAEGLGQLKWEHFKTRKPLKHFLKYDSATRGPWGCIQLLLQVRRHNFIASTGAVVTILIIAVDPFTQQLIRYSACNEPATNGSLASLSRSSKYFEFGIWHAPEVTERGLTINQKNAIINGFFNSDAIRMPVNCPTGNCTFNETFATVGFCSECLDVTSELSYSWTNSTRMATYENSNGSTTQQEVTYSIFNTTLPSHLNASWVGPSISHDLFSAGTVFNTSEIVIEVILGRNAYDNDFYQFFMSSGVKCSSGGCCNRTWGIQPWGCAGQGAARCKIKPCVKVINATVEFGELKENTVAEYTEWFYGNPNGSNAYPEFVMADLSCLNDSNKAALANLGHNVSSSRFIPYNVGIDYNYSKLVQLCPAHVNHSCDNVTILLSPEQMSLIPQTCIYQLNALQMEGLYRFFQPYLSAPVSSSTNGLLLMGETPGLRMLNNTYTDIDLISRVFANVAQGLTVRARQYNFDNWSSYNTPLTGTVLVGQTCVNVRWPWISYIVILTILTIAFFVAVVFLTEVTDNDDFGRGWKSSPLPLLYCGVDGVSGKTAFNSPQVSDIRLMEKMAEWASGSIAPDRSSGRETELHSL